MRVCGNFLLLWIACAQPSGSSMAVIIEVWPGASTSARTFELDVDAL